MPMLPLHNGTTLGNGRYRIDGLMGSGDYGITYCTGPVATRLHFAP